MSDIRDSAVYISKRNYWMLGRIAKATNVGKSDMDTPENAHKLADKVLGEWIAANHPKLVELYKQREALDDDAIKAAGGEAVPF